MTGTFGGGSDYGDTGDLDDTTGVAPFGATLAGVKALVPAAQLLTGVVPAGKFGVAESEVYAWLEEVTGAVAMRLDGWERLPATPTATEQAAGELPPDSDREQLRRFARTVIHNGAASYLEAARHPEQAGKNTTGYAAVLWDRYTTGLESLAGWLERRLAAQPAGDQPGEYAGGIAFSFPPPTFVDGFRV